MVDVSAIALPKDLNSNKEMRNEIVLTCVQDMPLDFDCDKDLHVQPLRYEIK